MVSSLSISLMVFDLLVGLAVPVALWVILVKKYKYNVRPILFGALTFFFVVFIIESAFHKVLLGGSFGALVKGNILYMALYGGLMAGLFEEGGRFCVMKWLLGKEPDAPRSGLAYGAGHGGIEMLILLASGMATNLVYSFLINKGQTDVVLAKVPAEAQAQVQAMFTQLSTLKPAVILVSIWERLTAVVLQLALSVIVWIAVRKGGKYLLLFPLAIILHAWVDAAAVIINSKAGIIVTEFVIMGLAIAIAASAYLLARKVYCKQD